MKPMLAKLTLVLATCLVLLASGPAHAAPAVDGEFDLSKNAQRIAAGPDGNMWVTFASNGVGSEIARIAPDGTVAEFDVDTLTGSTGIAAGPNGRLWVTISGKLGHFDPSDPVGSAVAIPVPAVGQSDIAAGPDGNLWTPNANKLVRVTPAGTATEFPILTNASRVAASADAIWVADFGGGEIVRVTTDGVPTRFAVGGSPQGVAVGLGGQVGYTNPGTNPHTAGRVLASGAFMATDVAAGTDPFGIAFGADQAYWFAQPFGNNLGRLTAEGAYSQLGGLSAEAGPRYLAPGPGNTLWVVLQGLNGNDAKKVARVSGLEPPVPVPAQPISALAPVVSKLRLSAKRFRVGKQRTAIAARKKGKRRGAKRVPVGTTIRFSLNTAADVRISFERRAAGRRNDGRCVKPKPRLRSKKRCTRWVKAGRALTRDGLKPGAQRIAFSGRIGRKALKPGSYRLTVVATSATGANSKPRRARFIVLAPKR
jgi:streptogramin lyase